MKSLSKYALSAAIALLSVSSFADSLKVTVYQVNGEKARAIGTVTFTDQQYGLLITPNLSGLTPGFHGFHIHEKPSCADKGQAAGGHFDPDKTDSHMGPYRNDGHLGDLPVLMVDKDGKATIPVLAPRLQVEDLAGHAIMIHAGGDNYSDSPEKLGGGGARVACGIIKANNKTDDS